MNTTRVMISLPIKFLREIDRVAAQEHRNRSELFREALRLYLEQRDRQAPPISRARVRRALAVQDAIAEQMRGGDWDSLAELRRWRQVRR